MAKIKIPIGLIATKEDFDKLNAQKADKSDLINLIYPVGAIYISINAVNPAELFGGTWERFARGQTLVGYTSSDTDFNAAGKTGGSKTVVLTDSNLPNQTGNITWHNNDVGTNVAAADGIFEELYARGKYQTPTTLGTAKSIGGVRYNNGGSSAPIDVMPPYITVYMWQRTS